MTALTNNFSRWHNGQLGCLITYLQVQVPFQLNLPVCWSKSWLKTTTPVKGATILNFW